MCKRGRYCDKCIKDAILLEEELWIPPGRKRVEFIKRTYPLGIPKSVEERWIAVDINRSVRLRDTPFAPIRDEELLRVSLAECLLPGDRFFPAPVADLIFAYSQSEYYGNFVDYFQRCGLRLTESKHYKKIFNPPTAPSLRQPRIPPNRKEFLLHLGLGRPFGIYRVRWVDFWRRSDNQNVVADSHRSTGVSLRAASRAPSLRA